MAEFNLEQIIKSGVEKALNKPIVNGKSITEWAAIGMKAPRWISVKDRLPEDEGDVLVYGVSPRGRKKTAIMNYLAFEADRPRWALNGIWTVLYWMPIPEPPKEEPQCQTPIP